MKSSGSLKVYGTGLTRGILDHRTKCRAGTRRHEQEQERRKRGRATPGHPLREPFKHAAWVRAQSILDSAARESSKTVRGYDLASVRVTLTSKYPSGRFSPALPSNGGPIPARS